MIGPPGYNPPNLIIVVTIKLFLGLAWQARGKAKPKLAKQADHETYLGPSLTRKAKALAWLGRLGRLGNISYTK